MFSICGIIFIFFSSVDFLPIPKMEFLFRRIKSHNRYQFGFYHVYCDLDNFQTSSVVLNIYFFIFLFVFVSRLSFLLGPHFHIFYSFSKNENNENGNYFHFFVSRNLSPQEIRRLVEVNLLGNLWVRA